LSGESLELPLAWQAALIVCFGAATALAIVFFAPGAASSFDLLVLGASLGALATAGVWLWVVALRNHSRWGVALAILLWVPYVNFVVASMFARRYWHRGARAPALLALAGMLGETFAMMRMLAPSFTAPV
jgi:hypothetical protein